MKKLIIILVCITSACQPKTIVPQSFNDLLTITDRTEKPICTLPLINVRAALTEEALTEMMEGAFDLDALSERYKDNHVDQISILLRRAALKRRFNVESDETTAATKYYAEFDDTVPAPSTLTDYHTKLHYWSDRLGEQSAQPDPNSDDFNLRFCVLNEARAALHSASRRFILDQLKNNTSFAGADLIENINHETFYGDAFKKEALAQLFTPEKMASLSALERALMRGRTAILPTDPKTNEAFWLERDAEIEAVLNRISTHKYNNAAERLEDMTMIDQSLRMLFSSSDIKTHFPDAKQIEIFRENIGNRVLKVDDFNTAQIKSMLEGRGWFRDDEDGTNAARYGWLIAQHADRDPEFQERALTLIEADLDAPGVSKSNYAYLYDRVQMRFGDDDAAQRKLQRYGTQGRCTGPETWEPLPMEDPENIDSRRAEVGLGTMAEYKARFKNICREDQR